MRSLVDLGDAAEAKAQGSGKSLAVADAQAIGRDGRGGDSWGSQADGASEGLAIAQTEAKGSDGWGGEAEGSGKSLAVAQAKTQRSDGWGGQADGGSESLAIAEAKTKRSDGWGGKAEGSGKSLAIAQTKTNSGRGNAQGGGSIAKSRDWRGQSWAGDRNDRRGVGWDGSWNSGRQRKGSSKDELLETLVG